jgi:ankyrin repeat protein/GTPase SAR1 family protein
MASPKENDSPLHSAVRQHQLEEVRRLLDEPDVDVNCVNSNHETPLHLACALDNSCIVEILIAFGSNVYIKDSDNKDCYGRMNSLEICNLVNRLLYYSQTVWLEGPTFTEKDCPLHSAVKLGQLEIVQVILDHKRVDINDKNSAHETPLHIACAMGHNSIVHMLIINGASMCERDNYNNAPIHRAAGMGHTDIVDMITEFGCDPAIRGYQGRSLLHFACGSGNVKLLDMLVQRKFLDPVNDRDACGLTPLHIAVLCGHEKIINIMLIGTLNFICLVDCQTRGTFTSLHLACIGGHINIVKLLVLEHDANLNAYNHQNDLPLHLASQYGHTSVVKTLIEDLNCNQNEKGFEGNTILHKACKYGHNGLAQTLITEYDLDPMCVEDNGFTPLHSAAFSGHLDVVNMLMSRHNADVSTRNNQNELPLHVAARSGHTKLVKAFINHFNCNPNEKGFEGRTVLHEASINGHVELAEILITDFGLHLACIDDNKYTPLHYAAFGGHLDVVNMLMSRHNADVSTRNNQNELPLHVAARSGHTKLVKAFINHFNCNPNEKGFEGRTVLHEASINGHVELAEILITDFGLHLACIDDNKYTPLHYAALGGHLNVVNMLVSRHNADVNARNNQNELPLHVAARSGHTKLVKAFINDFNCNPNEKGFEGRTVIHEASVNGHVELAEILITDFGLDPMCVDDNKYTPLHSAALGGHLNVVNMLMSQHNADINARNNQNELPLHIAARKGHTKLVKAFINDFNCNPNEKGFEGRTVLHKASVNGHVELAETLITDFGLDPMCLADNKYTPLHSAALGGHLNVVNMLMSQHNADINARNNQNELPLHVAARRGHTKLVKAFINHFNCNPNEKGFEGRSILHQVSINGHVELAETLITDFGLDPMCVDDDENTPLHYAAWGGHLSVVRILVSRHNVDINARNNQAVSPLQLAAKKGYTNIVKAMIDELNHKAKIEGLQSQAALTSFSYACEKGSEDLAITLIADLVCLSPLSADNDGNTLLHIAAMHGREHCVTLLLHTYNAPVYVRNNAGKTARDVTKLLSRVRAIIANYLKQNTGNIQDDYKRLQLLSSKKYSGEQRLTRVFVVGNILSGKSTLIESLKREGFIPSFGKVTEDTVPLHTSGIIPSVHDSKTIGRILYYDFAGDPEYYSSHSAIISNVIQSKVGTSVFLIVLNFSKDISKIQEELGYWLYFISYHSKCVSKSNCTVTVMIIGSHIDRITSADMNRKLKGISRFTQAHFSKILPGPDNFEFYKDTLTLNCRQPRSAQGVRNAIFQISKDTQPFNLSPESAILLGLLEKDFKNVITCDVQRLLAHINDTHICLPTAVVNLYPVLEQLHAVGLLMIIGRHSDKLEDHIVLLNISKLTNEVHELLFSSPTVDDDPNLHAQLSMGVLPQSYLNDILPEYITLECLVQLQYCQPFDHFEVKFDHVAPANDEHNDSTLFYFPTICKSERKESIVTPDGFNYYIGYFAECEVKLEYFPPRFLHLLFLRLAYSYALQAAKENTIMSDVESVALLQTYNRRCTMWKNGIHWLMQEGVECFVESVNNSNAIVVITKSKEERKSTCSEMLFKIVREFQQVKDEVCETVTLQQYILDSDDPSSCSDRDKLFEMSQVDQVLREKKPSIVSVNGKGHLDAEKIVHFMKCTLWGK